jgi:hypothetical protein
MFTRSIGQKAGRRRADGAAGFELAWTVLTVTGEILAETWVRYRLDAPPRKGPT